MTWSVDAKPRAISDTWPLIPQERLVPSGLFLTILTAFLMGKKMFFTFGKYQRAGKIATVYRGRGDKNKGEWMTTMVSIRKYFLICQPRHTFPQQVDNQNTNPKEETGDIFRATSFQ